MALQFTTRIDKKGRVLLPVEILQALHLAAEDSVVIAAEKGKITLQPVRRDPDLINKNGLLVIRPQITGELANAVEQNREARVAELADDMIR